VSAVIRGNATTQTSTVVVDDIPRLMSITVATSRSEYPFTAHLTANYSDDISHATSWLISGNLVSGSDNVQDVLVSRPALVKARFDDGNYSPQERTVYLCGEEPSQLAVSEISTSTFRGRSVFGGYTDFTVFVKNDGYTTSWALGQFVTINITDATVVYGDYTAYKVRVNTNVPEGTYLVSFTAKKGDKTKVVSTNFSVKSRGNFELSGVQYTVDKVVYPAGQPLYVDEGSVISCAYIGGVPTINDGSSTEDLYKFSWEYTDSRGNELPPMYGKSQSIDTSGYGGGSLYGYLVITDPYGNSSSVELDVINVSRKALPASSLSSAPSNPVVAGVPVVVNLDFSPVANDKSLHTVTWGVDSQVAHTGFDYGAVIDTTGTGGSSFNVLSTVSDDHGISTSATVSVNVGNRKATDAIVWNDARGNKAVAGSTIHFYACAVDPDVETAALVYTWNFTNPVSVKTGPSVSVVTTDRLAGTKIKGTVTVYDTVTGGDSTTYTIDDVLITGSYVTSGETPVSDGPNCPTCSSGTVVISAPILSASVVSNLYTGSTKLRAFEAFYSGIGVVSIREQIAAGSYSCDTGWVDAPNPTRYTLYRDWSSAFSLSSGCTLPFSSYTGNLTYTVSVRMIDGSEYSSSDTALVSLPKFSNEDLGDITATCASGYCGALITVHIAEKYNAATTDQSYSDLGLTSNDPNLAQEVVNSRARSLANAELTRRTTDANYCTLIGDNCVCAALSDLDAAVVSKWSGDTRTAAQAAVLEILAGNWATYSEVLNAVRYTFEKTNVANGVAKLCLTSALSITPDAYITIVFDSSGSMNSTLTSLQTLAAGKLYRALQNVYGSDYSTHVGVVSDSSESWLDFFKNYVKPSTSSPSRKQIILVFEDEDSNYDDTTAATAATSLVNYGNDPAKFDYVICALFAVNDGSTPYVGDRWDYLYQNLPSFRSAVDAGSTATLQIRAVKNVAGGGTESYYFGLIQQVLSSSGITIVDPDA
jgi:hypothetical protein